MTSKSDLEKEEEKKKKEEVEERRKQQEKDEPHVCFICGKPGCRPSNHPPGR